MKGTWWPPCVFLPDGEGLVWPSVDDGPATLGAWVSVVLALPSVAVPAECPPGRGAVIRAPAALSAVVLSLVACKSPDERPGDDVLIAAAV
jgi:hypothetical protein